MYRNMTQADEGGAWVNGITYMVVIAKGRGR